MCRISSSFVNYLLVSEEKRCAVFLYDSFTIELLPQDKTSTLSAPVSKYLFDLLWKSSMCFLLTFKHELWQLMIPRTQCVDLNTTDLNGKNIQSGFKDFKLNFSHLFFWLWPSCSEMSTPVQLIFNASDTHCCAKHTTNIFPVHVTRSYGSGLNVI